MTKKEIKKLVNEAIQAKRFSQAKYSNFKVGAALLTKSGEVYSGCNVESSSYSLTICAERVALVKALSEGEVEFEALAISAKRGEFCPPCGACRQLLYDYAPNLDIILSDGSTEKIYKLHELLPVAFSNELLEK